METSPYPGHPMTPTPGTVANSDPFSNNTESTASEGEKSDNEAQAEERLQGGFSLPSVKPPNGVRSHIPIMPHSDNLFEVIRLLRIAYDLIFSCHKSIAYTNVHCSWVYVHLLTS